MEQQEKNWEMQVRKVNAENPFMIHNGIYAVSLNGERAKVRSHIEDFSRNAMGSVHGGLMFLMGETAAGLLVRGDGGRYVTLDCSFRYLRAAMGQRDLIGEAVFVKRGKTIAVCRSLIREDGSDRILAEGEYSFFRAEEK